MWLNEAMSSFLSYLPNGSENDLRHSLADNEVRDTYVSLNRGIMKLAKRAKSSAKHFFALRDFSEEKIPFRFQKMKFCAALLSVHRWLDNSAICSFLLLQTDEDNES